MSEEVAIEIPVSPVKQALLDAIARNKETAAGDVVPSTPDVPEATAPEQEPEEMATKAAVKAAPKNKGAVKLGDKSLPVSPKAASKPTKEAKTTKPVKEVKAKAVKPVKEAKTKVDTSKLKIDTIKTLEKLAEPRSLIYFMKNDDRLLFTAGDTKGPLARAHEKYAAHSTHGVAVRKGEEAPRILSKTNLFKETVAAGKDPAKIDADALAEKIKKANASTFAEATKAKVAKKALDVKKVSTKTVTVAAKAKAATSGKVAAKKVAKSATKLAS